MNTPHQPLPPSHDGEVWLIALMIAQHKNGGSMLSEANLAEAKRLVAGYEAEKRRNKL